MSHARGASEAKAIVPAGELSELWGASASSATAVNATPAIRNAIPIAPTPRNSFPRPRVRKWQPAAVGSAARDALLDEEHPLHAVVDVGINRVECLELLARGPQHHVVVGCAVDIGKGLEKRLRMSAGQPAGRLAGFVHIGGVGVARIDRV